MIDFTFFLEGASESRRCLKVTEDDERPMKGRLPLMSS
jgi:hypothetical protein